MKRMVSRSKGSSTPGAGPYDLLYSSSQGLLWDTPGRLVRRVGEWLQPGVTVFDAGCGDGKNAVALLDQGYRVAGCDVSEIAIEMLRGRLNEKGHSSAGFGVEPVEDLQISPESVDCLLSYGLFHCLQAETRLATHQALMSLVRPGGFVLFSALLDSRPMPRSHQTPSVVLPSIAEVERLFEPYSIVYQEVGTIRESHPPLVQEHEHDGIWIVASL